MTHSPELHSIVVPEEPQSTERGTTLFQRVVRLYGFKKRESFKYALFAFYLILFLSITFFHPVISSHAMVSTGEATAMSQFLLNELKHEAGPNYPDALDKHKQLVESGLRSISDHQVDSPEDKAVIEEIKVALQQCQALLSKRVEDEDAAREVITIKSATILENLCAKLARLNMQDAVPASKPWSLFPQKPNEFVQKWNEDFSFFKIALTKLKAQPSYESAQAACMASRFASMTGLLASPNLAWSNDGKKELETFSVLLEEASDVTATFADNLQRDSESMDVGNQKTTAKRALTLTRFSNSENRRNRVVKALIDNNFHKVVEVFKTVEK